MPEPRTRHDSSRPGAEVQIKSTRVFQDKVAAWESGRYWDPGFGNWAEQTLVEIGLTKPNNWKP